MSVANLGREPDKPSMVYFPICETQAAFAKQAKTALAALTADQIDRVRSVQPFVDLPPNSLPIGEHPLLVLHHLNRIDKHRELHLVRRFFGDFAVEYDPTPPHFTVSYGDDADLVHGSVLASVRFLRPPQDIAQEGLPVRQQLIHGEMIAATFHTPDIVMHDIVNAMYKWTLRAVFTVREQDEQ